MAPDTSSSSSLYTAVNAVTVASDRSALSLAALLRRNSPRKKNWLKLSLRGQDRSQR